MMNDKETIMSAYDEYTIRGIIVHPLSVPEAGNRKTGKSPVYPGWNERKEPYHRKFIEDFAEKGNNFGIVCGKASDVTVLDIDWYCSGIIDHIFNGLTQAEVNNLVRQKHEKDGKKTEKGHFFFRYAAEATTGINKELGFDVLGQNVLGKSNNCVCYPSIHADGSQYRFSKDIASRTEMPKCMITNINEIIELYAGLKDVFCKCRPVFSKIWRAVFADEESDIYHNSSVFRVNKEGRDRSLGLFAELLAHGATAKQCSLACMMIFGRDYDDKITLKELRNIDSTKTLTSAKIMCDEYLGKYATYADFDPFEATIDEMEKKLSPRAIEAYERILIESAYSDFDAVRRAFLVGAFSNGAKAPETKKSEDMEELEPVEKVEDLTASKERMAQEEYEKYQEQSKKEETPKEQDQSVPTPGLDILKAAGCII